EAVFKGNETREWTLLARALAARLKRTVFHEILKNRVSGLVTRVTTIRLNRTHAQQVLRFRLLDVMAAAMRQTPRIAKNKAPTPSSAFRGFRNPQTLRS